jgi:VanZ family protein
MAIIFSMSTDAGSSRRTSRIIGPLLRWFNPAVSDETIERVQTVVRKGGHLTEYAILAALLWRGLRQSAAMNVAPALRPWRRREAILAVIFAALFAATDEWHQSTVPSRQGQVSDVILDSAGATAGVIALAWLVQRQRRPRRLGEVKVSRR